MATAWQNTPLNNFENVSGAPVSAIFRVIHTAFARQFKFPKGQILFSHLSS